MIKGLVSCIIPIVRNDIHVKGCIEAVEKSTYKNYEVIVVDEGLERSAQRNIGIKRAKGEFLIFLDSDMRVTSGLLQECIDLMQDEKCVAIFIPERIVTQGWFGKLRDWERQFYNGSLVDVVRFIRATHCPDFDEEMHGVEDSDWERRIRGKRLTSKNHFDHHDKCGVVKYLRKKAYYAKCLNVYRRKNPQDQLLTLRYRCFQVFVEKGKWKRLVSAPHLACSVGMLLFARGMIAVWATYKYR